MPVRVVDQLEMVQVHDQQRHVVAVARTAVQLHGAGLIHVAPRQRIGQRIVAGQIGHLLMQALRRQEHQADRQQHDQE